MTKPPTPPLPLRDKIGNELKAGDKVQIVNGAHAGKVIYKIKIGEKPYTIRGQVDAKDETRGVIETISKKVRKIVE